MNGDMTLVQMGKHHLPRERRPIEGFLPARYDRRLLCNKHRHTRSLRIIVLFGDIQNPRTNHIGHLREDLRETVGVVLFINVLDIVPLLTRRLCITNIINIETQRLCQIVKPVQFQLPIQRRSSFLSSHDHTFDIYI